MSRRRSSRSPTTTRASSTCPRTRRSAQPYAAYAGLDDPVIEINLTPNRPDCTSVHGIARDLAAAGPRHAQGRCRCRAVPGRGACPVGVTLEFDGGDAHSLPDCSRCASCAASGTGRRPDWMQRRLAADRAAADQRPRRHHQLRHLRPRPAAARLRRRQGDGRPHGPPRPRRRGGRWPSTGAPTGSTSRSCVIADEAGVESIAGIMGGEHSGCDESTTDVLIESALWDPLNIAQTGPPARHHHGCALPLRARRRPALLPCPASSSRPAWCSTCAAARRRRSRVAGALAGARPHHRLPLDRDEAPLRPRRAAARRRRSSSRSSASAIAGSGERVKVRAALLAAGRRGQGRPRRGDHPHRTASTASRRSRCRAIEATVVEARADAAPEAHAPRQAHARGARPRRGGHLVLHRRARRRSCSAAATGASRSRTRSRRTSPTCARACCRACSRRRSATPTAAFGDVALFEVGQMLRVRRAGRAERSRRRRSGAARPARPASGATGTAARSRSTPSTPRRTRSRSSTALGVPTGGLQVVPGGPRLVPSRPLGHAAVRPEGRRRRLRRGAPEGAQGARPQRARSSPSRSPSTRCPRRRRSRPRASRSSRSRSSSR